MSDKQFLQKKIDRLQASINDTHADFSARLNELKNELSRLREKSDASSFATDSDTYIYTHSIRGSGRHQFDISLNQFPVDGALVTDANNSLNETEVSAASATDENLSSQQNEETVQTSYRNTADSQNTEAEREQQEEPGFISSFLSAAFQSAVAYIMSTLLVLSSPVQELIQRVIDLYHHYQEQGKAPVFLMTVGGLVTLTLGFGYLLQYSFNTFFNDTLKAISGFILGAVIIAVGVILSKRDSSFKDYAASVIALGVVFNYLTAYFIGPYYGFVSETSGFLLLLVITAASFVLAIVYETRIISALTLIGGVFMPLIIGGVESAGIAFLAYLLILSLANLYLSYRINWPVLSQTSFFLSLSVIEFIGVSEALYPLASIVLLSGFFYVYTYYWSFNGLQIRQSLSNTDLSILVANAFYFIYVVLQIPADNTFIAGTFIIHAVVLLFTIRVLKLIVTALAPIYMLMAGLLIATAVFVLLPSDVTSIVWAIEGLAMFYIGFKYTHKTIRAEGSVIYIIAMTSLLWHVIVAFADAPVSGVAWHWVNLFAFGILCFIAYRIVYSFKEEATLTELKASFVLNEVFSFWGAVCLSLIIVLNLPSAMGVLAFIPIAWSLYRSSRHQLKFSQITAYALACAFIAQILYGLFNADSGIMTEQRVFTWIAFTELLVFMWGMKFYYIRYEIPGNGKRLSFKLHYLTFFVPAVLLALSVLNLFDRHIDYSRAFVFSYLWLDFIITGALIYALFSLLKIAENILRDDVDSSEQIKHRYILNETVSFYGAIFFLYSVAILMTAISSDAWVYNAAIIPLLYLLHRGIKEKLPLTEGFAWLHFSLFGAMTYVAYKDVGNMHFSEQSFATMVGWLEIILSAWALQLIYSRLDSRSGGYKASSYVRTGVYLILPILFLPRVLRLYEEYLALALWLSFSISWLMYKKIKIQALLIELSILFVVAVLGTVLLMAGAINGQNEMPALISLSAGIVMTSVFHYIEKIRTNQAVKNSPYYVLILISPYYYCFAIAAFTYAVSREFSISLVMSGLFLLYLLVERRLLNIMRDTLSLAYIMSWLLLASLPVLILTESMPLASSAIGVAILLVLNLLSLTALWYLTHQRSAVLQVFERRFVNQNIQFWTFHCLVLCAYVGSLNLMFTTWSVGVSIALLIHAVVLLFLTLSERYKGLFRLSLILFSMTAVKVIFYDMEDFENLHKVMALMGIGSILMVAAFLFQKLRNRQLL